MQEASSKQELRSNLRAAAYDQDVFLHPLVAASKHRAWRTGYGCFYKLVVLIVRTQDDEIPARRALFKPSKHRCLKCQNG